MSAATRARWCGGAQTRTLGHLVPLDVVGELHALLGEAQQLLLVRQVQPLALRELLRAEEPLLLADDQAQLLDLLQLALLQVLLARALAQVRHRRQARGLVLGQLALLFGSVLGRALALLAPLVPARTAQAGRSAGGGPQCPDTPTAARAGRVAPCPSFPCRAT